MQNSTRWAWAWLLLLGLVARVAPLCAQHLAAGRQHTVAIHTDGTLWAWGDNSNGQLGTGDTQLQNAPVRIGAATTWASVSAGSSHTVAIRTDGSLWAWGSNFAGQLGTGTTPDSYVPVQIGAATNWQSVSAGDNYTLAIRTDGTLWAWGYNSSNQLGDGTSTNQPVPVQIGTATTWQQVSAGSYTSAALRRDGSLWTWGSGPLGRGSGATGLVPAQVGTASWLSVAASFDFMVAVRQDGTLWSWGSNYAGQLGNGTTTNQLTPAQVGTVATWRQVSAGQQHAAAVRQDGTIWAWGNNDYGQLGTGARSTQLRPVPLLNAATTWTSVSAGGLHTVAQRQDGTVWAWGALERGQVGATGQLYVGAGAGPQFTPRQLLPADTWQQVGAGSLHSAAIRADGSLWTWGGNAYGQLGNGAVATSFTQYEPARVGTATNWQSVSAGYYHTVALRQDGTMWAWGGNSGGMVGNGTTIDQPTPVQVGTGYTWRSVSAGPGFTLAIRADGTLWAWGYNYEGQLGIGSTVGQQNVPTQVGTATNWASLGPGWYHALATRTDGTLWAWGSNVAGQLGLGTTSSQGNQQRTPVQVGTATNWASVAAGISHSVARRTDGTLWAWGSGNGQTSPAQVGTATTWASVTTYASHSAAIKTDGTLWTWGQNDSGQLGLGRGAGSAAPAQVGTATTWQRIALGDEHSLAVRTDGTLWVWGSNSDGQLAAPYAAPAPINILLGGTALATNAAGAAPAWSLAPNPAHDRARLLGLPPGPLAGQLFDAQGRLVRTTTAAEVELAGLAPGLYLLHVAAGGTTRTLRLAVE